MNGNSEENKIREAFEEVRLPEGAKERMYANILQKAELAKTNASSQIEEASQQSAAQLQEMSQASSQIAQQAKMQEAIPAAQAAKTAQPKKFKRLSWRKYASLAACLVIFIAAGAFLPGILDEDSVVGGDTAVIPPASQAPVLGESAEDIQAPEAAEAPQSSDSTLNSEAPGVSQNPQAGENSADDEDITLSPSPFEEVTSTEDFSETLGFSIDAPEGAEDVSYSVAFGETAIVDFTFDDHAYTYYASKTVEDISAGEDSENALSRSWESKNINYLLVNTDGADKTEFEKVLAALQNS